MKRAEDRLHEVFCAVRDLPPELRERHIEDACHGNPQLRAELLELLHHHDHPVDLVRALDQVIAAPIERPADSLTRPAAQVAGHRLIRVIGTGGSSTVFEAEVEATGERVALKLLQISAFSAGRQSRFRREIEILGRLDHPGIARLLSAGTAETLHGAQPYFAMELVEGLSITRFAAREQLDTGARIALFLRVCEAVQHAHALGVIHRDLKPANILVDTAGLPRVLDFGIARIAHADPHVTACTVTGDFLGTVPYMSPEQAAGNASSLDARSDVYSLAVILFELLSGQLPHRVAGRSLADALRIVREDEPTPLGNHGKALRGSLQAIVAQALERDVDRRYPSVAAFSADLCRHQRGVPVFARGASALAPLRTFARRHRRLVAAIVVLIATLLLGVVGTGHGLIQARRMQRMAETDGRQARIAQREAEQYVAYLTRIVESLAPARVGRSAPVDALLDEVCRALDHAVALSPIHEGSLRHALGATWLQVGELGRAAQQLEHAARLRALFRAEHPLDEATTLAQLGRVRMAQAEFDTAHDLIERAGTTRRALLGADHPDTLAVESSLARVLREQARFDVAEPLIERVLDRQRQQLGPEHPDTLESMNTLAILCRDRGRFTRSEELHREVHAIRSRTLGTLDAETLSSLANLGEVLTVQARYDAAEQALAEATDGLRRTLGELHPRTLRAEGGLGVALKYLRRFEAAEEHLQHSLDGKRQVLSHDHPDTLRAMQNLGLFLLDRGRLAEAEPLLVQASAGQVAALGPDHPETTITLSNIGTMWLLRNRPADAACALEQAVSAAARYMDPADIRLLTMRNNLAYALDRTGHADAAEREFLAVLHAQTAVLTAGHRALRITRCNLGQMYLRLDRASEAEPHLAAAAEDVDQAFAAGDPAPANIRATWAECLLKIGRADEARPLLESAYAAFRGAHGEDHSASRRAATVLTELCENLGDPVGAALWRARQASATPAPPGSLP